MKILTSCSDLVECWSKSLWFGLRSCRRRADFPPASLPPASFCPDSLPLAPHFLFYTTSSFFSSDPVLHHLALFPFSARLVDEKTDLRFSSVLSPHPPCLYCLDWMYILTLTCIVYCLYCQSDLRLCYNTCLHLRVSETNYSFCPEGLGRLWLRGHIFLQERHSAFLCFTVYMFLCM